MCGFRSRVLISGFVLVDIPPLACRGRYNAWGCWKGQSWRYVSSSTGLSEVEIGSVMSDRTNVYITVVTGLWLLAIGGGLLVLLRYSYQPGAVGAVPERWPEDAQLRFVAGRSNLVMFLHPRCPCSRATVRELEELVARDPQTIHGTVIFVRPASVSASWVKTGLWEAVNSIPGISVAIDSGGRSADRFGAKTSGHTFLFDPSGSLVFSGGITMSRGHEGDSSGRDTMLGLLATAGQGASALPSSRQFPVFGCPLLGTEEDSSSAWQATDQERGPR